MDPNTGIDPIEETPLDTTTPDNGGGDEGSPDGQGGTPDPRDQQIAELRRQNQLLNKNVIDARRQPGRTPNNGQSEIDLSTPEGQYGVALQVAENQVRSKLEEVLPLYPELTPDMVQRIRRNPWSFASREAMLTGNAELAAYEIEKAIYDHIESLPKSPSPAPSQPGNPAKAPARVNNNSISDPENDEVVIPGTMGDTNPWTMPLDKLEQLAVKESRTAKK